MCPMPAGIVRRDGKQVDEEGEQCQIDQLYPPEEEQINIPLFPYQRNGKHDGHHRRRCSHQRAERRYVLEIREDIIRRHEEQCPRDAAQQIDAQQLPLAQVVEEHFPKPVEPQHVEEDVQHVVVDEHIGYQRPRLPQEILRRGGEFQILQHPVDVRVEQRADNPRDAYHQEDADVDVYQPRQDRPAPEGCLQIINNIVHRVFLSFANNGLTNSRTTYRRGGQSAPRCRPGSLPRPSSAQSVRRGGRNILP